MSKPTKKVTIGALNEYNQKLVDNHEDNEEVLLKNLQQERLYQMMKANHISRDRPLWNYLDYYASDRSDDIQRVVSLVANRHQLKEVADSKYDADYLSKYFEED